MGNCAGANNRDQSYDNSLDGCIGYATCNYEPREISELRFFVGNRIQINGSECGNCPGWYWGTNLENGAYGTVAVGLLTF